MADSPTAICNLALRKLREQPIAALTENSETARLCHSFYDDARDDLLARHPHNFAMRRQALVQLADPPAVEWRARHALPTEPYCLRAVRLWRNGRPEARWRIEGRALLSDAEGALHLLYVARVDDVTAYSPTFVEAFACRLAALLAYPLTRSAGAQERMQAQAEAAWKRHRLSDGGEGWQEDPEAGVFTAVRQRAGGA